MTVGASAYFSGLLLAIMHGGEREITQNQLRSIFTRVCRLEIQ